MRSFISGLALVVALAACDSGSDETGPTSNHTITITNEGTNTTECLARQFTRLTLTPSGGGATVEYSFVSSPYTTVDVPVTLPQTGSYDLYIYAAGPTSIWWTGLAMGVGGVTPVQLRANNMGFTQNSYASGIRPTWSDISCQ